MSAAPPGPRRDLAPSGRTVPARWLPVAAGVLAGALVLVEFTALPLPVSGALALAVGAVLGLRADVLVGGGLILLLSAHQLWHYGFRESDGSSHLYLQPMGVHADFLVLLAGVHLLHVLVSLAAALPARGSLELAVLRRPAVRFLLVQVPVQLLACGLLAAQGSTGGIGGVRTSAAGVLGAVVLAGAALAATRAGARRRDG